MTYNKRYNVYLVFQIIYTFDYRFLKLYIKKFKKNTEIQEGDYFFQIKNIVIGKRGNFRLSSDRITKAEKLTIISSFSEYDLSDNLMYI